VINYGTGTYTIEGAAGFAAPTGGGVTITAASATQVDAGTLAAWVGNNSTVIFHPGGPAQSVTITGDLTGGSSASFAQTTLIAGSTGWDKALCSTMSMRWASR